jgi:hypothetical protein
MYGEDKEYAQYFNRKTLDQLKDLDVDMIIVFKFILEKLGVNM